MTKYVLASNSPRRKELLTNLGVKFDILVKDVEENQAMDYDPYQQACENAYRKALATFEDLKEEALVIAADTVVFNGKVLNKPRDEEEAFFMLKALSGKEHDVITGIALLAYPTCKKVVTSVTTKVYFKELKDEEILKYISSGEPMDKAGSYGIQGKASLFVEKIEGDFFNVVGLPLFKIEEILNTEFNMSLIY